MSITFALAGTMEDLGSPAIWTSRGRWRLSVCRAGLTPPYFTLLRALPIGDHPPPFMPATVGSRLGPYEIIARLGAGGMGEVFKARDPRLERSVAIKVLPASFADNPQLKARFEREAKTISQLNHPHICTVHDYGHDDGTSYLVMELVDGETLSDRLKRGAMPIVDVLRYGAQIADALDRAHRAGIVHRDLKPGNVMLTKSGAKLLDFGLARSTRAGDISPDAPTQEALTGEMHVVGTLPYMSPEQLQGSEIDNRTDIFAFGAVLYEMVTRRRAFSGTNPASLIANILEHQPPRPSELLSITPPALEHVILTCLQKDADARYQCAADVAHELRWIAATPQARDMARIERGRVSRRVIYSAIVLLLATAAVAALWAYRLGRRASKAPVPVFAQLTFDSGVESHPTISPDGKMFAFVKTVEGKGDIFLQRVDGRTALNLTNTATDDEGEPAFSPDGSMIAFRSDRDGGGIFVMGATGESIRRLTDKGFNPSWSPDGKEIVFSGEQTTDPVVIYSVPNAYIVDVATGRTRIFYKELDVMQPAWSPHGHRVAFWTARRGQRDIYTVAKNGDAATVTRITSDRATDWNPTWSSDGRYLYFSSDRDGTMNLWRVPIDERTGRTKGDPEAVRTPSSYAGLMSISRDGRRIVYKSQARSGRLRRIRFDAATERLTPDSTPLFDGSMFLRYPVASPDGKWIAFGATAPHEDVYVMAADGSGIRQLTNDIARDRGLTWWPDGSRILFYSNRDGEYDAWTIRPDGSGLTRITQMPFGVNFPKVSPDLKRMAFVTDSGPTGAIADLTGTLPVSRSEPIPNTPRGRFYPQSWSPDGKLIVGGAYGQGGMFLYSPEMTQMRTLPRAGAASFIDDRRILFVSGTRIGIHDVETSEVRFIGELPADPQHELQWASLAVHPHSILAYQTRVEADIWQMSLAEEE